MYKCHLRAILQRPLSDKVTPEEQNDSGKATSSYDPALPQEMTDSLDLKSVGNEYISG